MKKLIETSLYVAGTSIGLFTVMGRTIEVITYSEFKTASCIALCLCALGYGISKVKKYN